MIKPKQKAADKAYAGLREMIIRLDLEPGAVLDDRIMTKKLGVGRTPLREAIHRLASAFVEPFLERGDVAVGGGVT